jgi:hypothetical protein
MDARLTGDAYFALDINREIELTASGPIHMNASSTQSGKTLRFNSEGKAELRVSNTYSKASGKLIDSK